MSSPKGEAMWAMAGSAGSAAATNIDAGILDQMIETRRHLHRNPELSNCEANTQRCLRQMLAGRGMVWRQI